LLFEGRHELRFTLCRRKIDRKLRRVRKKRELAIQKVLPERIKHGRERDKDKERRVTGLKENPK
jgi:hypothetical protein